MEVSFYFQNNRLDTISRVISSSFGSIRGSFEIRSAFRVNYNIEEHLQLQYRKEEVYLLLNQLNLQ